MTIAETLAERIAAVTFESLPPDAVHWAKVAILDTVGCILAGANEPCARIIGRQATIGTTGGDCLVFGHDRRVGPLEAALINGTAAHALDYDDCSDTLGGHPSAPVLPALFALAETRGSNGRDFIAAYVTGWEAETRVARGINFHRYEKGWHPTATIGVFGAAAACARLMGLPPEQIARALALAATFSSGIKANFGTMTKPLHVGHAARNGLLAALLASDGFTARADAFEHKQGFLNVFNGAGNYDADRITDGWGDPWDIVSPGLAIKQYPCCGSTHPAIDAMLMLVREHDLKPSQVARIEAQTHAAASPTPTARTRKANWMRSSACSTASPALWSAARSASNISKASPIAIPPSGACSRASSRPPRRRSMSTCRCISAPMSR